MAGSQRPPAPREAARDDGDGETADDDVKQVQPLY